MRGGVLLLAAVAALLVPMTAVPAPASAVTHGHHHASGHHRGRSGRHRATSQARLAKWLVARLARARGTAARAKATLAMMRALHISVVSSSGKPIAISPEPNAARRFALYDFELRGLGNAVARGPVTDLAGVSAELTRAGLTLDATGKPFPPKLLRAALLGAVKQAVHRPRSGRSLLPLIVRQLGLVKHPRYDLARRKVPRAVPLDALQAWLITADMEISVLRHVSAGAHASSAAQTPRDPEARTLSSLRALLGPRTQPSSLAGNCEKLSKASEELSKKIERALGGKIQKWIEGKAVGMIYDKVTETLGRKVTRWGIRNLPRWAVRGTYTVIKHLNLAKPILDALHGVLLAFSVDVRAVHERLGPVHWLHSAGDSGHQMTFETKVTMLDDYGELLVKCGSLAGFKMPPKGPMEGVLVGWTEGEKTKPLWPDLGSVGCTVVCVTETGKDGIARLTFTPKQELIPGIGLEREETGIVTGTAAYQTAADSGIPEELAQYLTPKQGSSRWSVTYHEQPQLTLRMVDRHDESFTDQVKFENSFGEAETTGTGAGHFALSAVAPLQVVTATDGSSLFTGDAPINWDGFSYNDDNGGALCQDGHMGVISYDGSAPSPGELIVDSVESEAGKPPPALKVKFHASVLPTFTVTQSFESGASQCAPFSNTVPWHWWVGPQQALLSGGIVGSGSATETSTSVYTVSGWQPGPATQSGEGLYAYRDFSYSGSDYLGQPYSGSMRLELQAEPKR
jgi:hypothetical protein